jgi:hypothetical protein
LRPCDPRHRRQSGSTRCQMQKVTARKVHGAPRCSAEAEYHAVARTTSTSAGSSSLSDEKGQEWKCGLDARDALAKLIANCTTVRCEDMGPDTVYPDRRIGLCTLERMDITLNKWLVREGWALNFEPYARGRFLPDQRDAEKNRRGIWKGCFAAPTNWRHWRKNCPLMGSACPSAATERIFVEDRCSIKGSQSRKYHMRGCPNYDSMTNVVKWFCSEDEARAEGYTRAGNCPASSLNCPRVAR